MKYRTTQYGREVPDLTKGWKVRWFLAGLLLGLYAPGLALFFYSWRMPTFLTVKKVAVKFSLPGAVIVMAVRYACESM